MESIISDFIVKELIFPIPKTIIKQIHKDTICKNTAAEEIYG